MNIRRYVGALFSVAILAGCSQGASLNPRGSAPTIPLDARSIGSPSNATLRFFSTPTAFSWPDYITMGSDGNLWFTEFYADQIGRITPNGTIREFPLPDLNDIEGITSGADGNLWFTEPGENKIGRMTASGVVSAFPLPDPDQSPRGITAGPDGNVWFADYYGSAIGRITPSGVITQFAIPESEGYPWWITTGKDGDLWFTESGASLIGRFNPRTQKFEKPIPVPGKFPTPWGIMTAPDGHTWFTERVAGDISVVFGGAVHSFHIARHISYPDTIVSGPDGNLWFTDNQAAAIGRLNPTTGKFLKTIVLPSGDIPTGIAVGRDGNIWFTVANYDKPNSIGEVVLH
jgi:streptogramin lyase